MNLEAIMLGSENPKTLGDFYTSLLGNPSWQDGEWYGFTVDGANLMVGPHSEVKGRNPEPARIMLNFTTDAVKEEFARIKELGAEVIAEPYQVDAEGNPDMWLATFADPDGNYFQLATPWKE